MFGIKENECVGFHSQWKVTRVQHDSASQTTGYSVVDCETSTPASHEIEIQTEAIRENVAADFDETKLSNWLKEMYPKVRDEIDSTNCNAFKEYDKMGEYGEASCKLQQSFNVFTCYESGEHAVKVSSLSWNCTGQTLAVSCTHTHTSWCHHQGILKLYVIHRNGLLPETPTKKLTSESCIDVISFHPELPYVIAGGTHTGEVIIWNVQNDEGDSFVTKTHAHDEAATQIMWIHDAKYSKSVVLATSSLDGFLNLWNFTGTKLTPKQTYKIKSPVFPKNERYTTGKYSDKVVRGIICYDFSPFTPDMFVVGLEGGLVVQCTLNTVNRYRGSLTTPVLDPVYRYHEPHEGEITTVSCSTNRREMFLTAASDGQIRIYLLNQEEPAQMIYVRTTINGCVWVPHEEKLIVACGSKGLLELFNVVDGRTIQNAMETRDASCAFTCMQINRKRTSMVAVGTSFGGLQIWNCPWHLFR